MDPDPGGPKTCGSGGSGSGFGSGTATLPSRLVFSDLNLLDLCIDPGEDLDDDGLGHGERQSLPLRPQDRRDRVPD